MPLENTAAAHKFPLVGEGDGDADAGGRFDDGIRIDRNRCVRHPHRMPKMVFALAMASSAVAPGTMTSRAASYEALSAT